MVSKNPDEDDGDSSSTLEKEKNKEKISPHVKKGSAPPPEQSHSLHDSKNSSPPLSPRLQQSPPPLNTSPPLLSPPASKESTPSSSPSPSPPLPSSPSPSPKAPSTPKPSSPPLTSPPPPSPPPPSPPPPSPPPSSPPPLSAPPPQRLQSSDSFPPPYNPRRQSPPPPFRAPPTPARASSQPRRGSPKNDTSPGKGSSPQAKQGSASPSNSTNSSSPASSSGDNAGKYVGYTLAGIFAVALVAVAVALVFAFKKKKARGDAHAAPYMPPLNIHVKSGANGHYYVQQPGPQTSLAKGTLSMNQFGAPLDSPQPKNAQIFFTYDMVMEITNAFSSENVIGEGGFGFVYKGWLADGKVVAVKQLKVGSGQGEREFKAEVEIISRVHHRHLVSLVGYCIFEQQRILIYEYVPNGTLHHHLHESGMPVLDWAKRLKIAIGAAKGLAYLHEDCSQKIIHRDIKSANILLDNAYEAQVADFGLARLADAASTHVSTRVMGTFGYMAPEYATSGKLTDRSDVFSFGVVLLELVTGRKPVDQTRPLGDESLVEWARPLLPRAIETRDFGELIDPRLEKHFVESEMLRMIEAAAACVRHSAPRRPRMVQVVRTLDWGYESSDLSNGVKYGHSLVYDSGQYDKEIMLFRRMANGTFVDSDFDMYSRESSFSRGTSKGSQQELMWQNSSGESESRAINRHRSSTE